jgi:uncharacterized tellurite resistance protein B-like protein
MGSVQDRILVITDLLLGAVYADNRLNGEEEQTVRNLLSDLLGSELPQQVERRIKTFPANTFDLKATAKDFASDPPINKRRLLELVAAVRDADEEIDLAEDQYMVQLAKALEMDPSEYQDLTLDYEVEELRASIDDLRKPPPVPKS